MAKKGQVSLGSASKKEGHKLHDKSTFFDFDPGLTCPFFRDFFQKITFVIFCSAGAKSDFLKNPGPSVSKNARFDASKCQGLWGHLA